MNDHPEFYWVGSGYNANMSIKQYDGKIIDRVIHINPEYNTWLLNADAAFDSAVNEIIGEAGITPSMSEYERSLRLHNVLALAVEYDLNAPNAHNAYGAIVDKAAVCEGYAEAYQYLLQFVGIQSLRVTGYGTDAAGSVGHAWNLVRIDGQYYYTDLTWDDHGTSMEGVYYSYFNITKAEMEKDHLPDDRVYALPAGTAAAANWFKMNPDHVLVAGDVDKLAAMFIEDGCCRVLCTGNIEEFGAWLHNNMWRVVEKLGCELTGCTYSHQKGEYHLKVPSYKYKGNGGTDSDIIKGDVNGDGAANGKDLVLLRRYMADPENVVLGSAKAADLNGDGVVNGKDLVLMRKQLAG